MPAERLAEALDAGLTDLGENRAQELLAKAPVLADHAAPPTWHFVGQLQRNKVTGLVPWVTWWHSVDRFALGEAIAREGAGRAGAGRGEPGRGAAQGRVRARRDRARWSTRCAASSSTSSGLMTVAPQAGDRRGWFAALRDLATTLAIARVVDGHER